MLSERDLVQACIKNDRIAQKKLFEIYSKQLFSTAYRIITDYDLANDVLQEAFIEVFKNLKSFKCDSPLFFWMKTIVVRKAIKMVKKQKPFEVLDYSIPANDFNDEFTGEDLDKAILQLPVCCRSVFVMIEIEGYKHKEVAEILNISEGTSKSQLNYSKKILRNLLKEIYNGR